MVSLLRDVHGPLPASLENPLKLSDWIVPTPPLGTDQWVFQEVQP
jgi:hypothetical protein